MEHTLTGFDEELKALHQDVVRLGALAEHEAEDALKALRSRNDVLAQTVVERDSELDDLELVIEERATRMLATRQPVADDLRRIVAAMKMAGNLERCGDLAKNIAKRALAIGRTEPLAGLLPPIDRLGRLVLRRLRDALQAYREDDLVRATDVWSNDREVDELYDGLFRELLTHMMSDPRTIAPCTHLLFIAKNLERIGDHATNIAEVVHYAITAQQLGARPKLDSIQS